MNEDRVLSLEVPPVARWVEVFPVGDELQVGERCDQRVRGERCPLEDLQWVVYRLCKPKEAWFPEEELFRRGRSQKSHQRGA